MYKTENGLMYHAPTYDFRKEKENESICDTVSGPLAEHLQSIARGLQDAIRAQTFCEKRLGMDVNPENPDIYVEGAGNKFIYGNGVTEEKYTVVEVTV